MARIRSGVGFHGFTAASNRMTSRRSPSNRTEGTVSSLRPSLLANRQSIADSTPSPSSLGVVQCVAGKGNEENAGDRLGGVSIVCLCDEHQILVAEGIAKGQNQLRALLQLL